MSPIALLSVSDKTGLIPLAQALVNELGFKIISSGGTAKLLERENLPVTRVADYTGFPEILGGRVKTLNPKIHGGILATRSENDMNDLNRLNIFPIDLVVCNLYPFDDVVSSQHETIDAIETRERLLDVESLLSGDKYSFVKDAYIQSIAYEVKDGINVEDDFVDDMDDFLID